MFQKIGMYKIQKIGIFISRKMFKIKIIKIIIIQIKIIIIVIVLIINLNSKNGKYSKIKVVI